MEPNGDVRRAKRVFLTGGSGFVGGHVLRRLLAKGHDAVCLVRTAEPFTKKIRDLDADRITVTEGSIFDESRLAAAMHGCDAVIHLVGIILESRLIGQTFERVHTRATKHVVRAALAAGVTRFVHMSALGSRPDAPSKYHRTKWAAEEAVRNSGLRWTIFRPSLIHGPDGEFMELMKTFVCGLNPPVLPYIGSGDTRVQPVSVRDVASCVADALARADTEGKEYDMGGRRAYTWKELFGACQRLIPGARPWKPLVSMPVPVARIIAATVMKTPLVPRRLKFNADQVRMAQEDSVCDPGPIERTFGITLRDFEQELAVYGDQIR